MKNINVFLSINPPLEYLIGLDICIRVQSNIIRSAKFEFWLFLLGLISLYEMDDHSSPGLPITCDSSVSPFPKIPPTSFHHLLTLHQVGNMRPLPISLALNILCEVLQPILCVQETSDASF